MATLSMSIGALSDSITVSDANAQRVLESAYALFHQDQEETPAAAERLEFIVHELIPTMLVDKARQYEEWVAIENAKQGVSDDPPEL